MLTDTLKLNDDKTEFMLIGTKQQLSKVNIDCLIVGSMHWRCSCHCGKKFREMVRFSTWICRKRSKKLVNLGFFHLYNIRRIRKYLSQESARTLVLAFIIHGHIDYCNSPLALFITLSLNYYAHFSLQLVGRVPTQRNIIHKRIYIKAKQNHIQLILKPKKKESHSLTV